MALLPVYQRIKPDDLTGVMNGKLPDSLLVTVTMDGADARVHHQYARAMRALMHDLRMATGITNLGQIGDYRSYEEQVNLLKSRYRIVPCPGGSRYWDGKCWQRVQGAVVATPGTSDHGWGLAVDFAWHNPAKAFPYDNITTNARGWAWIRDNATRYGLCWAWDELDEEPWHLHLFAIGTAAVLAYEAGQVPPPPPPPDPPPAPGPVHDIPVPTLREGSTGNEVVQLQLALKFWKWYPTEFQDDIADGRFGARTKTGVQNMQVALAQTADGVYGPVTAAAYDKFLTDMENLPSPCPFPVPPAGGFRIGDSGVAVKELQALISWWGVILYKGVALTLDGEFGNATHGAVVAWQSYLVSVNRLPTGGADGVFGPQTREASCGLLRDIGNL